jgi:hypothetical protein
VKHARVEKAAKAGVVAVAAAAVAASAASGTKLPRAMARAQRNRCQRQAITGPSWTTLPPPR